MPFTVGFPSSLRPLRSYHASSLFLNLSILNFELPLGLYGCKYTKKYRSCKEKREKNSI